MKEKFSQNSLIGKALIALAFSFFATQTTSAQCMADGASIEITGGGTSTTICAGDGVGDPIAVTNVGVSVGTSSGWVITDNATGEILGLPPGPPFDLEGAGGGVCDIWYIRYESDLMGLTTGANVADLTGCFDFSNAITVTRNVADAAAIEITGTGETMTSICVDGTGDPIDVSVVGMGIGDNSGWVITDNATGDILGLPPGPPFDLDGAGGGVCDIWYIRYNGGLSGLAVGENVADLTGCFDLSNAISVNREGVDGSEIQLVGTGGDQISICAGDGVDDLIDVELLAPGVGDNGGWVITDNATGAILGLPAAPPFNLEGAGAGVCDVWYIRYADGLTGLDVGQNVADLDGCFDFSNPVTVTRLTGADCDILAVGDVTSDFEFSLFPNPATSVITLTYNGNLSTEVAATIYDMSGRLVTQTSFETQVNTTLDVSDLSVGTYLITIEDLESGTTTTKRLIKR